MEERPARDPGERRRTDQRRFVAAPGSSSREAPPGKMPLQSCTSIPQQ
jgi:hypothetical protein